MPHDPNERPHRDAPWIAAGRPTDRSPRVLITAGPTHEPIDAVRYIGNRSSGRVGVELADAFVERAWSTRLLLGPSHLAPAREAVELERFVSTADLERLLAEHLPACDVLVMAAAVADYRPTDTEHTSNSKLRRTSERLVLELEPTPDLLAGCHLRRREDQLLIGFALEPRDQLRDTALRKMERKGVDAIVANPLETMESNSIEAWLLSADGAERGTDGLLDKAEFGRWLAARIEEMAYGRVST